MDPPTHICAVPVGEHLEQNAHKSLVVFLFIDLIVGSEGDGFVKHISRHFISKPSSPRYAFPVLLSNFFLCPKCSRYSGITHSNAKVRQECDHGMQTAHEPCCYNVVCYFSEIYVRF